MNEPETDPTSASLTNESGGAQQPSPAQPAEQPTSSFASAIARLNRRAQDDKYGRSYLRLMAIQGIIHARKMAPDLDIGPMILIATDDDPCGIAANAGPEYMEILELMHQRFCAERKEEEKQ